MAEKGHTYAQYEMGLCYQFGCCVPQDKVKAHEWYVKAAAQGYEMAVL